MTPDDAPAPDLDVFADGGEVGARLRQVDWSATPLGPVETWPTSFRTALGIILRSRFPMFVFWGPELLQLYNDAYVPILGDKHPRSLGAPARETWGEIWDVLGPLVEAVVERGEATWSEDQLLMMRRHGFVEETYFTFSYSPVLDGDGVGGVFCACTETTERVLADRRIRAAREVAERTRGAVTATDVARRALEVLGEVPEDVPVATIYLVAARERSADLAAALNVEMGSAAAPWALPLDAPDDELSDVARAVASGEAQTVGLSSLRPYLPEAPWGEAPSSGWLGPIVDPATGEVSAVLAVGRSPRRPLDGGYEVFLATLADNLGKALADALARQREQERLDALAELNRAKTEFFSNVSHEFRTPLTLILGQLAAAGDGVLGRDALEQVHRSANRLLKLVSTVLDVAQVEAGRLRPGVRPTDLAASTVELAGVFRSAMEAGGLEFDVGCEPLPEPAYVDVALWEKVVLNLLSNALKFTRSGRVAVRLEPVDGAAVLRVSDTGEGIAPEHLPHLFERFYRVPGSGGRTHEGSGIGLALVRELVELHGGSVGVESVLGSGTTVTVTLPLGSAHLPPELLVRDGSTPSGAVREAYVAEALGWVAADRELPVDPSDDRPTVLVVDDNADIRRYLRQILSPFWAVRTAEDGDVALEVLREHGCDVVVADVMMPRRDGSELVAAIRADPALRHLPVVMLSARAGVDPIDEGFAAGADDYVVKPFTPNELVARVRANLELAAMRTRLSAARTREQMITGLSHDMQTPLAFVLGALEQLADPDLDRDDREVLVRQAQVRAAQLRRLVRQFLDEARIGMGAPLTGTPAAVELGGIVDEVVGILGAAGRVRVEVLTDRRALADADRVEQVVTNVLENALRYSDGTVDVRIDGRDGELLLTVEDEGPGVAPDERERVFERYERGRAAEGTRGSGLGLYVGRALVEAQGGRLEATERSDGRTGARFELALPAVEEVTDAGPP